MSYFCTRLLYAYSRRAAYIIDVKNVLEKIKNVKKRKKRGQNNKRLKTLNKKRYHLFVQP